MRLERICTAKLPARVEVMEDVHNEACMDVFTVAWYASSGSMLLHRTLLTTLTIYAQSVLPYAAQHPHNPHLAG
jgi:hypothetical protein